MELGNSLTEVFITECSSLSQIMYIRLDKSVELDEIYWARWDILGWICINIIKICEFNLKYVLLYFTM